MKFIKAFFAKLRDSRRADLEFKFRTCQITEEEIDELKQLRA